MSYFKQSLRNNMIICFFYAIILITATHILTVSSVKTELDSNALISLTQISSYMDNCISKTFDSITNIMNEHNVSEYANSSPPTPSARKNVYTTFTRSLGYILSSDSIIAVTTDNDDSIVTNNGTVLCSYFPDMIGVTAEEFAAFRSNLSKSHDNTICYITSRPTQNKLTIGVCNKSKYKNAVYVFVTLPLDTLMQFAEGFNAKYAITVDDALIFASDAIEQDILQSITDKNKKSSNITSIPSSTAGFLGTMTYYQILPQSYYQTNLVKRLLLLYLVCTVCLIFVILLIMRQTKKNYAPIKDLLSLIDNNYDPEMRDEFSFIKNRFNALSSDNRSYSEKLDTYKKPLEESNLIKLLNNTLTPDTKEAFLSTYSMPSSRRYISAMVEYSDTEVLSSLSADSRIVLRKTIIDMFTAHFEAELFFRIISLGDSRYAFISTVDDIQDFKYRLHKFVLSVGESIGTELAVSLGSAVDSLGDIHHSFQTALNVSQNRMFGLAHSTICSAEDLKNYNKNTVFYPIETESAIIESISRGTFDVTMQMVVSLISENFSENAYTAEQYSQFILMMTATFNRIFALMNKKSSDFFSEDVFIYLELKSCKTPDALSEKILSLMRIISDSVKEHRNDAERSIGATMTSFIDDNYTKDISLIDLAECLNFSAEHTSRLFKQITKKNFKEYLMHYRFLKACELIEANPNMKLKDIAASVGCTNTTMLSRIFLKYTNLTVSDYMKKVR